MNITDVKCYVVPRPGTKSTYHWRKGLRIPEVPETVYTAILKVETDEGYVGHAGGSGYQLADLTYRYLKPELIGQDPLLTEHLWHRAWELHRLGAGLESVLAIDAISWDIKSQVAGLPAYLLMGGNDPKVPAYASTVTWDTMEEYERHIKECADEGFFAFKLHASGDAKWDAEEEAYLELYRCSYSLPDEEAIPDWRALLAEARARREAAQPARRHKAISWSALAGVLVTSILALALVYRRVRKPSM